MKTMQTLKGLSIHEDFSEASHLVTIPLGLLVVNSNSQK